ncbi:MAG: hypothetical protein P1U56_04370 [Saprospiraceae bacterium]|nr:hypothetical protein [Saprospiraceae bacterium]
MNFIPTFKQITNHEELSNFSQKYFTCSGLPIPDDYMQNEINRVFAVYWKSELVGGFILGRDVNFRTLEFFAKKEKQSKVIDQLEELSNYTEICCFWIQKKHRTNTYINMYIWLAMTYALRMYGTQYFLFGTCSRSLARLYAQTPKSIQIHRDRINNKATFIFKAHRSSCVSGMLEIISHKLKRTVKTLEPPKAISKFSNYVKAAMF